MLCLAEALEAAELLIRRGASLDIRDNTGATPRWMAEHHQLLPYLSIPVIPVGLI